MLIPLSWLREYVDIDIPAQELAHRLTMAGVEVGEVVELGGWKESPVGSVEVSSSRYAGCMLSPGQGHA